MSYDLARRPGAPITRQSRQIARAVEAQHGRGLEATAHVNAAAFVARTALAYTALLSAEESRWIEQVPLGEARYKAIVDAFTGVACAAVVGMAT